MDVAEAPRIDNISAKFLKDGAPVMLVHLANIINLSIKLDTFPSICKIKPQNGIKTEAKNYRLISHLPLNSIRPGSLMHTLACVKSI